MGERWPETYKEAVVVLEEKLSAEEKNALRLVEMVNPMVDDGGFNLIGKTKDLLGLRGEENIRLLKDVMVSNPEKVTNLDFMADRADPELAAVVILYAVKRRITESRDNG